jgi:hypothetical protein
MGINFGSNYTQIEYRWKDWFSSSYLVKNFNPQYYDDGETYTIYGYDGPDVHISQIFKNSIPYSLENVYSQTENDEDKNDFEINYKSSFNTKLSLVPVGGSSQSTSYPDVSMYETGDNASTQIDAYGNLMTRGTVLTDEESFREGFSGTELTGSIPGTLTFTSGSTTVTGTGTSFTTDLNFQHHIRLLSDDNSFLTRIDYIVDDTTLELVNPYEGSSNTGEAICSYWYIREDTGTSYSVSSSCLTINAGTTNGSTLLVNREGDYLPFILNFHLSLSQRIENQEFIVGFEDNPLEPQQKAVIVFNGTSKNIIRCITSFADDSIEETEIKLPGNLSTDTLLSYEIDLTPNSVSFLVNNTVVATHKTHLPKPYAPLQIVLYSINTGTPVSNTKLKIDNIFFENVNQVQIGAIFQGEPIPIVGVAGANPINVSFGTPGGGTALPKMINTSFIKSEGAILANVYKRVLSYTVPDTFTGYLIKFTSFQGEAASSRVVSQTILGTFNNNTNSFSPGSFYTAPQWAPIVQANVTTAFAAGSGNTTLTITYTNELGVSNRSGTIVIPKGSAVNTRFDLTLASGDLGVRSIENITTNTTLTGVINILGLIQLAIHQDQSTTTQTETIFQPGSISFPANTILGIEYAGGTVAKSRNFDLLIQLV